MRLIDISCTLTRLEIQIEEAVNISKIAKLVFKIGTGSQEFV